VKELKGRDMEFHTYKPKQERNFKVVLQYMHAFMFYIEPENNNKDITKLNHFSNVK